MRDEIREHARQHGVTAADYVAQQLQHEGMEPVRASELLNALILKQVEAMRGNGVSAEELIAWIHAVEAAFDERLAELAGPDEPART